MTDAYLFTPDLLEDLAIATIGKPTDPQAGILYHFAKLERLRGLRPRTLEPPKTVSHMANPDAAAALSGEQLPSVTFTLSGARTEPVRTELDTLDLPVQLAVRVNVMGRIKRDTLRRRDWTAFCVIECLLQRLPRSSFVSRLDLVDFEPIEAADESRIRGEYAAVFNVWIPDAIQIPRELVPDPYDPYTPPDEPPIVTTIDPGITKIPLTEDV